MENKQYHEGAHHDEALGPWQRILISCTFPHLLVNVAHPWRMFIVLVFLSIVVFMALFFFNLSQCSSIDSASISMISYSDWNLIFSTGTFYCFYYSGYIFSPTLYTEFNAKNNDIFLEPDAVRTAGSKNITRLSRDVITQYLEHFSRPQFSVPCATDPRRELKQKTALLQPYVEHTGDTEFERFFCGNWDPRLGKDKSAFYQRFGKDVPDCPSPAVYPSAYSTPGTFEHEQSLFLVRSML